MQLFFGLKYFFFFFLQLHIKTSKKLESVFGTDHSPTGAAIDTLHDPLTFTSGALLSSEDLATVSLWPLACHWQSHHFQTSITQLSLCQCK